jgi:ribonuclease HIII
VLPTLPAGAHIGADESGKGDYFGPLVCGAVCADHELMQRLIALGVRDCKELSNGKVSALAIEIDRIARRRVAVTILEPEDYNREYDALKNEGKNANNLLARAHARSIEELLLGDFKQRPKSLLIDRFATPLIETLMPTEHWGLEVFQVYEAEADAAVAAASIVARARFLEWMNAASERLDIKLPKGTASNGSVVEVARVIAARDGDETLRGLVKWHHKTTEKVLDRESNVQVNPVKGELRPACSWRKVRPDSQNLIRERLLGAGAVDKECWDHVAWRLELACGSSKVTVVLYENGTCERKAGYSPAADHADKLIRNVIET